MFEHEKFWFSSKISVKNLYFLTMWKFAEVRLKKLVKFFLNFIKRNFYFRMSWKHAGLYIKILSLFLKSLPPETWKRSDLLKQLQVSFFPVRVCT